MSTLYVELLGSPRFSVDSRKISFARRRSKALLSYHICTERRATREELALMYWNLKQHNLGGFSDANYWSSTEKNALYAAFFDFNGGQNYDGYRYSDFRVRPIRAY